MIYGNNGLSVTAAMWVSAQGLYTKGLSNSSEDDSFFFYNKCNNTHRSHRHKLMV